LGTTSCWSWLPFVLACALLFTAAALASPRILGAVAGLWRDAGSVANPPTAEGPGNAITGGLRPVNNDCSGGNVYFTFDDGPYINTVAVLDRLKSLNIKATFYVIGDHIEGRQDILKRELSDGHRVQNHTYHHPNLVTGVDVNGVQRQPWGDSQIEAELERANSAIIAAGAPRPIQYRPPYGSVNAQVDHIAQRLGLRLVMSWGNSDSDNIVDSKDTEQGVTSNDIVHNVTLLIKADSIISMHDGEHAPTLNDVQALQPIVDDMNAKHLCSSTDIRPDATGGVLR
jgi:peptidoglycan/xylan/chitin deacetylase (PgdA/CDA1 family)